MARGCGCSCAIRRKRRRRRWLGRGWRCSRRKGARASPGGWGLAAASNSGPEARPDGPLSLPNLITLLRLCAVPAAVWLIIQGRLDLAFFVFVGAGVSDALDGWIARRWNLRSALGALLDPVADKALLVSVYVTLALIGVLPDWLAILVVFRDVVIMGGVVLFYLLGRRGRSSRC